MDTRFLTHNTHLEDSKLFEKLDPQLRRLSLQPYRYHSPVLDELPSTIPGIYTIGGGRQIGKTTLLKQWMQKLMQSGVDPNAIVFFSGELIDDHHSLIRLLQNQIQQMPENTLLYILLDEITYIKDWDKAIKYAADGGLLDNVELVLTGSDLIFIQEARMRFPGRRGKAKQSNFHIYPLSFRELVQLKHPKLQKPPIDLLFDEFKNYLIHGGYLTAINDLAKEGRILESTLLTYSDWVRGDMLKRGKQETYLREILLAIIKRFCTQITWNALARDLSIDHPKTVADYVSLLEAMDAVFIQAALLEDKLTAAPKKARKIMFADPFIFHAIRTWLMPEKDNFSEIVTFINNPIQSSLLVESCTITHYRRFFPTYYIKAEGEVDIAFINKNRFWPVEIKWTNQLRQKDLKQIMKYQNGLILTKNKVSGDIQNVATLPLPLKLWQMNEINL